MSPNLRQQDFEVYEDGVRQSIRLFRREDSPVTVGLVVDHSGSMRQKLPDVIAAARTFVRSSNREDQMFVVNFNEKVTLGLPAVIQFTNRSDELERAPSHAAHHPLPQEFPRRVGRATHGGHGSADRGVVS